MGEIVLQKSMDFSVRIVKLCNYLRENKNEYTLTNQLLRSGTSVGANLREAEYAQSKTDFIHKNSIALKEISETEYWLELLYKTEYLTKEQYDSIQTDCSEIAKILTAIVKKSKNCESNST